MDVSTKMKDNYEKYSIFFIISSVLLPHNQNREQRLRKPGKSTEHAHREKDFIRHTLAIGNNRRARNWRKKIPHGPSSKKCV